MQAVKIKDQGPGFAAQQSITIEGVPTEFVFHRFANRYFVLITQYGRIPNLYKVQIDCDSEEGLQLKPMNDPNFHSSVPVTMKCTLGADKDEIRAGIQYLMNRTSLYRCPSELLIGLGLKETNGQVLKAVAEALETLMTK